MNPNILNNTELDDYRNQDQFDFVPKADAIKYFLEYNPEALEKNKMLVLYGDWGSGKTSLMKHIDKEIDKGIYKTIFFHAWEHEKDENLALSLCDALTDCVKDKTSEIVKDFMKGALLTFKSFASGVTLKSSALLSGLGLEFEFSGEKYIEAIDKALEGKTEPSFFIRNAEFKKKFRAVEDLILQDSDAKKILVFVDDLDRCEPENVLNLITALKLFFTYGNNTIFFSGMDKEAVTKAVKTKYKDVVKAEEYMEKVFDISFNMPKASSFTDMLEPHFKGVFQSVNGKTYRNVEIIHDFLKSINFTNPRHIKKILSKYEILKLFKSQSRVPADIAKLIPQILDERGGHLFETVYCLFFIILHEFFALEFKQVENYDEKLSKYVNPVLETFTNNKNPQYAASQIDAMFKIKDYRKKSIKKILEGNESFPDESKMIMFLIFFAHDHPTHLSPTGNRSLKEFANSFDDSNVLSLFCKFLIKYESDILNNEHQSYYILWDFFLMINYLL